MKICIIHLSDFHVDENVSADSLKVDKIASTLNQFNDIDKVVIAFSGDLAAEGLEWQYRKANQLFSRLFKKIKEKCSGYIELVKVPGNHDLCFNNRGEIRDENDILDYYSKDTIEQKYIDELSFLNNYYKDEELESDDKIIRNTILKIGKYKIQFNLLNSAPFSTLNPKNKELHHFPQRLLYKIKREKDVNCVVSIMHHDVEWFNWKVKDLLEKELIENSEFILYGHNHSEKAYNVGMNDKMNTNVFYSGETDFNDLNSEDSFNLILINTDENTFDYFIEKWDRNSRIYASIIEKKNIKIVSKNSILIPSMEYLKSIEKDDLNSTGKFTDYYTFPKLVHNTNSKYGNDEIIDSFEKLKSCLDKNHIIYLYGNSGCGKTSLLKYIYIKLLGEKVPLFLTATEVKKLNYELFVKRLFEEQYTSDKISYERFKQLDKKKKILIIDDIDRIELKNSNRSLLDFVSSDFEYIIVCGNLNYEKVEEKIKSELIKKDAVYSLEIKPFFLEKREELVSKVCVNFGINDSTQIDGIIKMINSLVKNNPDLFSLNPGYLVKYVKFLAKENNFDYTEGERTFSKIFEYELHKSIVDNGGEEYLDELLMSYQLIAGFMYENKLDSISTTELKHVIEKYNDSYSLSVSVANLLKIAENMNLMKIDEKLNYYFVDKNYFAYLIAQYLLDKYNTDDDKTGIEYAFNNICFEINEKIVLYILYLTNDYKTIMVLNNTAEMILEDVPSINLDSFNISFIGRSKRYEVIAPTEEETKINKEKSEYLEENRYKNIVLETKGVFSYDESIIDNEEYRLRRAFIYIEILSKSLSIFFPKMKKEYKDILVHTFYNLPNKLLYKYLSSIDNNFGKICESVYREIQNSSLEDNIKSKITINMIQDVLQSFGIANILAMYCHFSELCLNKKTFSLLDKYSNKSMSENIQHMMIYDLSGNTAELIKQADSILSKTKNIIIKNMVSMIIRNHVLTNKKLKNSEKQSLIDKYLDKKEKKLLITKSK